jgi:hypothetical protein
MFPTIIEPILLPLMLGCSIAYMLEPAWRLWRNRPGSYGPLYGEFLLPLLFLWLAFANGNARALRVSIAVVVCVGALLRLAARKRFGIPAWPPV